MKKLLMFVIAANAFAANAQYKKANFFETDGRTYEAGTNFHLLSNGRSTQNGLYFSFGKETEKKFFLWYDLELTLPSKIATTGIRSSDNVIENITGTSKYGFIFRYSLGYFLLNQQSEKNKINPFLKLGFNIKAGSSIKLATANATTSYSNFEVPEKGADGTFGVDLGIGTKVGLSKNFSLRFIGGYNVQFTEELFKKYTVQTDRVFSPFVSHPFVSIGVQYRIISGE